MRTAAILVLTLIPPALPAAARPLENELPLKRAACWERSYDEAHLKAHPRQKVAQIRLLHRPADGAPASADTYLELFFNLRQRQLDSNYDYRYGGFCRPSGAGLRCVSEYAGGSFTVERGPEGSLQVRNGGITANPTNYDSEDIADNAVRIPARPDDGVWRLRPADGECRIE